MSNPISFVNDYAGNIVQFVRILKALETQNDMLAKDSTLITRYFAAPTGSNIQSPRTDIVAADITAAQAAIVQLLFTFNSGSPTQAAALYRMMP